MIWLSSNEGHLRQRNVTIRLLRINLGRVTRIFVITEWRVELVAPSNSRNHSVYMLQKHVFCREKVKGWNGHMYALPWGNSKKAQNPMRKFQIWTKLYEELPKMHKIPWRTSKNAQNSTRNFQKCTKSQKKLPNMQKIPRESSENAQNLIKNYQKSYEEFQKHPVSFFQKCKKSHEELLKCKKSH